MSDRRRSAGRTGTGQTILLAGAALLLILLWFRGCVGVFGHPGFPWPGLAPLGIWGLIQAVLGVWVAVDANRRGLSGLLWGLLVFFTGIVGLIVYLLVAPSMTARPEAMPAAAGIADAPARQCPACRSVVRPEFKACPYCGVRLVCSSCGERVEAGWKVCPFCAASLDVEGQSSASKE